MMKRIIVAGIFSLVGMLFSGCATLLEDYTKDWTAQKLYTEAKASLDGGDYETAIKYYEILEGRYPLGRLAQQTQLDMIYAYYKMEERDSAIAAVERFIKLYPRHPQVDYVYYMKGLVYFSAQSSPLEEILPMDMSDRDQAALKKSFEAFKELIKLFPSSHYSEDAHQRMVFLRDMLAQYELRVADFYLRREAYLAAARRAQYVIEHYQGTPAVPMALVMMTKAYQQMGAQDLAADALRVLKLNYPEHPEIPVLTSQNLP